jgi:hypothetical protein
MRPDRGDLTSLFFFASACPVVSNSHSHSHLLNCCIPSYIVVCLTTLGLHLSIMFHLMLSFMAVEYTHSLDLTQQKPEARTSDADCRGAANSLAQPSQEGRCDHRRLNLSPPFIPSPHSSAPSPPKRPRLLFNFRPLLSHISQWLQ